MPKYSSYRTNHGIDSVGSDWSSSQLIIGIAVAIVFGVTCFATGYVIAIYDNPLEPVAVNTDDTEQAEAVPVPPTTAPADSKPPQGEATPKGTQPPTSAPAAMASAVKTPVPVPVPEPAKPADSVQRAGLRPTTINALPEPGGPTPMVRTPVDMNKAPAPQIEPMDPDESVAVPGITPPAPTEKPAVVASNTPPVTPPANTVAEVVAPVTTPPAVTPPVTKKPVEVKPPVTPPPAKPVEVKPPPAKPAPAEEAPATPTVTKGSFGIQVASFDGPQRSTQAKDFQRNLKTKAQQNADIIVKDDGNYHTVVIPGYDTRDAARAACEKMKSKPGLEGAWVVRLP